MTNRRSILKHISGGVGCLALSPFLNHYARLEADDADQKLPKRFVFVVKASGLQAEYINPEGLSHGGDQLVDENIGSRKLPESLAAFEPFRDRLTILQGLSGRMCSFGHSSFYGALGAYKATPTTATTTQAT